jgi:hypothetical protein
VHIAYERTREAARHLVSTRFDGTALFSDYCYYDDGSRSAPTPAAWKRGGRKPSHLQPNARAVTATCLWETAAPDMVATFPMSLITCPATIVAARMRGRGCAKDGDPRAEELTAVRCGLGYGDGAGAGALALWLGYGDQRKLCRQELVTGSPPEFRMVESLPFGIGLTQWR